MESILSLGIGTREELLATGRAIVWGDRIVLEEEGDVFLVTLEGRAYVAKFYYVETAGDAANEIQAELAFRAEGETEGSQYVVRIRHFAMLDDRIILLMDRFAMEMYRYRERGWSPRDADRMVVQLLQAYAFIHRAGIAHEDLHEGNIMVDFDPEVHLRIIDFGNSGPLTPNSARIELFHVKRYIVRDLVPSGKYAGVVESADSIETLLRGVREMVHAEEVAGFLTQ